MLPVKLTYIDYEENERTETFYFNLTEAELTMWQLKRSGGMKKHLEKIMETQNAPEIMENFRQIIHMSYGEKSEDGRRFIKKAPDGHELADDFEQTEAYSQLIMKILSDEKYAADFVNGLMPKSLKGEVAKANLEVVK